MLWGQHINTAYCGGSVVKICHVILIQELIRRWDSERELFLQHRTCRGQRLRPL